MGDMEARRGREVQINSNAGGGSPNVRRRAERSRGEARNRLVLSGFKTAEAATSRPVVSAAGAIAGKSPTERAGAEARVSGRHLVNSGVSRGCEPRTGDEAGDGKSP